MRQLGWSPMASRGMMARNRSMRVWRKAWSASKLSQNSSMPVDRILANPLESMGLDMFSRRSTDVLTSSGSMKGL
jgi:hypothetical protein